ncbi:hypothetical protein AAC387_Pa02g3250 [Persea americana]
MTTPTKKTTTDRRKVCFSFAAYAKNLIDHLKACKIPVSDGLSDDEFASIEAEFGFVFPPDLRSILREGLPVGAGFPNWRSSSHQQLENLVNLPISGLCNEVSKGNFWCRSWGSRPKSEREALVLAKRLLARSPVLVPIYRHCYIPARPSLAGNPVFYVRGAVFRYAGYDVAGFFEEVVFRPALGMTAPAWAAKAARRIEFWSDLAERRDGTCEWKDVTCGWWEVTCGEGKVACRGWLEEMKWRLREGGWKEEEVREMMDGQDDGLPARARLRDKNSLVWHVRLLSLDMRKAGWSKEDVVYALGLHDFVGPTLSNSGSQKETS